MKYPKFHEDAVLHLVDRLKEQNPFIFDQKMQMWLMSLFGGALEIATFFSFLRRLIDEEKRRFHFRRIGDGDPTSLTDFLNENAIAEFSRSSMGDFELSYVGPDLNAEKGFFSLDDSALDDINWDELKPEKAINSNDGLLMPKIKPWWKIWS